MSLDENGAIPVHVSIGLPTMGARGTDADAATVAVAAQTAERLGFDAMWVGDHILHPQPMLDSVVSLAFAAARTERIGIEWSVLLLALRPLPVIAKQITTLASFAPGRVSVGVGVGGEHVAEWDACGVAIAERGRLTDVAARRLRNVLDGAPVDLGGPEPRRLDPTPVQPVAMFFGGRRPAALRRAALIGDGWVGWLHSPAGFAGVRATLRAERDRAARHQPFWFGIQAPVYVTATGVVPESVRFPNASERFRLLGSPDQILTMLRQYFDAGADRFKLSTFDSSPDLEQMHLLAGEVLPEIRSWRR